MRTSVDILAEPVRVMLRHPWSRVDRQPASTPRPRRAQPPVTEGTDTHSRASPPAQMRVALEADVQIYTIVIDNGSAGASTSTAPYRPSLVTKPWDRAGEHQGPEMLEKLSDQTGGLYFRVRTDAEAKDAVITAGRALRNEYVIGYHPPESGTARWHRIRVKLNPSRANVHARKGYYSR